MTVSIGYFLARQSIFFSAEYVNLIIATYTYSAAACGANNLIEQSFDKKMNRTKNRALVVGDISNKEAALIIAVLMGIATFFCFKD